MSNKNLKIRSVIPVSGLVYLVCFDNGKKRELNCYKLIEENPKYKVLNDNKVFWSATVDRFHKNIVFTENVFLSMDMIIKYSKLYDIKKENEKLVKMFYDIARDRRKKQNITQKEMADAIGVPQSAIARLERGEADVQLSTILNYLSPLGLTLQIVSKDVPNKKTLKAILEKDDDKSFSSIEELRADLGV